MGNYLTIPLDVTKGLISNMPVTQIPPGGCQAISNLIIRKGALKIRPGLSSLYSQFSANEAVFLIDYFTPLSGTAKVMALTLNLSTTAVKAYYWTGSAWSDITGSATLVGGLGSHPFATSFKSSWYFTVGAGSALKLYEWTGTGNIAEVSNTTPALSPPKGPRVVLSTASRLFLLNCYSDPTAGTRVPYRVAWSDYLQDDVWNGGSSAGSSGYMDLMEEPDPIVVGAVLRNLIFAFKEFQTYVITPSGYPTYFSYQKFANDKGCIAPKTIKNFKDALIFLGDDNIYYIDGQNIQPVADSITYRIRDVVNTTYMNRAIGMIDKTNFLYHLLLPKVGTDNPITIFTLDLQSGSWTEGEIANTSIIPVCSAEYPISGYWGNYTLLGSEDRYIYDMSTSYTTDSSTTYTPSWTSGTLDIYHITEGKLEAARLERVIVESASGKVTVYLTAGDFINDMDSETTGQVLNLDGKHQNYVVFGKRARYFKLRLVFDTTNIPEITRVYLVFNPDDRQTR